MSLAVPEALAYDAAGLVPVVVQEAGSGDVLMVAYANREALERTAQTGLAHFWSRSRNALSAQGRDVGQRDACGRCDRLRSRRAADGRSHGPGLSHGRLHMPATTPPRGGDPGDLGRVIDARFQSAPKARTPRACWPRVPTTSSRRSARRRRR